MIRMVVTGRRCSHTKGTTVQWHNLLQDPCHLPSFVSKSFSWHSWKTGTFCSEPLVTILVRFNFYTWLSSSFWTFKNLMFQLSHIKIADDFQTTVFQTEYLSQKTGSSLCWHFSQDVPSTSIGSKGSPPATISWTASDSPISWGMLIYFRVKVENLKVKSNGVKGTLKDGKLQYLGAAVLILLGFVYFTTSLDSISWVPRATKWRPPNCLLALRPKFHTNKRCAPSFSIYDFPWRPFKLQVAFLLFTSNLVDFVPGSGMN